MTNTKNLNITTICLYVVCLISFAQSYIIYNYCQIDQLIFPYMVLVGWLLAVVGLTTILYYRIGNYKSQVRTEGSK